MRDDRKGQAEHTQNGHKDIGRCPQRRVLIRKEANGQRPPDQKRQKQPGRLGANNHTADFEREEIGAHGWGTFE